MKKIKTKNILLISRGQPNREWLTEPLFSDRNGSLVFAGDEVRFYDTESIFPSTGFVENLKGLRISTFDNIFNAWNYYEIEV